MSCAVADATDAQVLQNEGDAAPEKTAKQLEKEAKKQAKLDKLKQKLEKKGVVAPKKENAEVKKLFDPYVNIISLFCYI